MSWPGRHCARGHAVTCLARGESGPVADGAALVAADRRRDDAYDQVRDRDWDAVIEVSWQPGFVRGALAALGERTAHWTYVSSVSAYASHAVVGADESEPLLAPYEHDEAAASSTARRRWRASRPRAAAAGGRLLIARAGLIGGPGDHSGRTGYWVARAARDPLGADAACRLSRTWQRRSSTSATWPPGCWTARGPRSRGRMTRLGRSCRSAAGSSRHGRSRGHTGPVVEADQAWLLGQGVAEFMGPESLPLWVAEPGWEGFSARSGQAAADAGLRHRPRSGVQADTLAWERERGLDRPRRAGPERGARA